MVGSSVIVDDLDVRRPRRSPDKADTPLVVDPDAVLASPIVLQRLESIARRHAKIAQRHRRVQHVQLPHGYARDALFKVVVGASHQIDATYA
jgi:hypothetical protein